MEDTAVQSKVKSHANQSSINAVVCRVRSAEARTQELDERLKALEGSSQKSSLATTRAHTQLKGRVADLEAKCIRP